MDITLFFMKCCSFIIIILGLISIIGALKKWDIIYKYGGKSKLLGRKYSKKTSKIIHIILGIFLVCLGIALFILFNL